MQRHAPLLLLIILLLPLAGGHTGSHDDTTNTSTPEHMETPPAPIGHAAAVDRTTAIASAAAVLLTLTITVFGVRRYTRSRQ